MAQALANHIRNRSFIRMPEDIYEVIEFQHIKTAQGKPFIRTKIKGILSGKVIEKNFPSEERIDLVRIERRPCQYLYRDGDSAVFMEEANYEQFSVLWDQIRGKEFLMEGQVCEAVWDADTDHLLYVELPTFITLEVIEAEAAVRGDSVTNVMKNAIVASGAKIRVPLFIEVGDKIKIDTRTSEYIERVKK